jgi:hypothetical protein
MLLGQVVTHLPVGALNTYQVLEQVKTKHVAGGGFIR